MCSRPAVSTITTSAPRSRPAATASKATAPGSESGAPRTNSLSGAPRPLLELLDGRGTEGVGGADDDPATQLLAQVPGQLADRGRLARAVDPTARITAARAAGRSGRRRLGGARVVGQKLGEPRGDRLAPVQPALLDLALQPLHDLRGRSRPTSAWIRASSRRSQASVSSSPDSSVAWTSLVSAWRVLDMFSRRRRKKPRRLPRPPRRRGLGRGPLSVHDEDVMPVPGHCARAR